MLNRAHVEGQGESRLRLSKMQPEKGLDVQEIYWGHVPEKDKGWRAGVGKEPSGQQHTSATVRVLGSFG